MFSGVLNLRKIVTYNQKDSKGILKFVFLISKIFAFTLYGAESLRVFFYHFGNDYQIFREKLGVFYNYNFIFGKFWCEMQVRSKPADSCLAHLTEAVYYSSYLLFSYLKESELKNEEDILENLKPSEVLTIIK